MDEKLRKECREAKIGKTVDPVPSAVPKTSVFKNM